MRSPPSERGFTLVELASVLVILGVLAALEGPKFLDTPGFDERGYADQLVAAIRAAESASVASDCDVQLFIGPGGYRASLPQWVGGRCAGPFTVPVMRPDGTPLAGTPPPRANVRGAATLLFGPQGMVSGPVRVTVIGTPAGQSVPLTLRLDPVSGFVTAP